MTSDHHGGKPESSILPVLIRSETISKETTSAHPDFSESVCLIVTKCPGHPLKIMLETGANMVLGFHRHHETPRPKIDEMKFFFTPVCISKTIHNQRT